MLPLHASGVAACTYHFFYNNPDLAFLVTLQAGLTALGNTTVAIAAFRLALSNGWTIGELDPRKLFSKGDDGEAAPAAEAEAAPAAAAYGGAAIVPSAAKLVQLSRRETGGGGSCTAAGAVNSSRRGGGVRVGWVRIVALRGQRGQRCRRVMGCRTKEGGGILQQSLAKVEQYACMYARRSPPWTV